TMALVLMSLSINITTNALIVGRFLVHRHRISMAMGKNRTSHYTGLITIFIESAAVSLMVEIIFTTTF
ncbi:hypothetical protein BDQ12DRAFT_578101, partial [Crucibulum laeve]